MLKIASALIFMLAAANIALADDGRVPDMQLLPSPSAAPSNAPPAFEGEIKPMRTSCWTNVSDCAGVANFRNGTNQTVSCAVFFNNGASGRSNWVYGPGQTHGIQVRYGDTFACVYGSTGVPDNASRSWIWVS